LVVVLPKLLVACAILLTGAVTLSTAEKIDFIEKLAAITF